MSEDLNISIMAQAETETVVESVETQQPTIAEAYEANHADSSGEQESRKKQRSERNTTVAQEEDTAREIGESSQRTEHAKVKREQSLAEAYEGIAPEAAEEFTLSSEFAGYDPADIEAVVSLLGLQESDLKEERFAALALKELQASFPQNAEEEGEDAEAEKAEEAEKVEEKKADEQKPVEPRPSKLSELSSDQRVTMSKHVGEVWNRSQQVNDPVYTEHFTNALGGILGTPPEQLAALRETVDVLQFGAQNLVESVVPALVHSYLQQNFAGVMESYAPGFAANYTSDFLTRTWDSVRGSDLPAFSNEPDSEFQTLAAEVRTKHPFLDNLDFKDASGKPLPMMAALRAKAVLTAKLCRGERATPKTMQEAVTEALDTGKRSAEKSNRRVSAGRTLGAGRTTGSIGKKEESIGTSLRDAYSAVHNREGGIV